MANVFDDLNAIYVSSGHYGTTDHNSYVISQCAHCDGKNLGKVGYRRDGAVAWYVCVSCGKGMVRNGDRYSPGVSPFAIPAGLPNGEAELWDEIRSCLSVNAYTAAVMLCRKLLLHLAVSNGLGLLEGDRSPTFAQAVNHLRNEGLITQRMQPWVDRIRDVGNEANHEIPSISKSSAMDVARFAEQLLKLTYEMTALMNSGVEDDSTEESGAMVL